MREIVLDKQPHHQARRKPPARDESTEWRPFCGLRVGVEVLGIVAAPEGDDFRLVNRDRPEFVDAARYVVLEVAVLRGG